MQVPWILTVLLAFGGLCAFAVAGEEAEEEKDELVAFDRLWDHARPDETEKRFRALLPAAEASGNADYLLQLLTQIARTEGLQGRFDEAHATLDRVEAKLAGANPATRVRYLLERGRAFNSSGKKKEARACFLEAWTFGTQEKVDFYALDAAHMMEIVEPKEEKLGWNEKAMKLAESSEDERCLLWLGALTNNRGWALFELGRFEDALEVHRKGWDWRRAMDEKKGQGVSESTLIAEWSVARMLRALERYDEALTMQLRLLEAWAERRKPDGFVHEELAENLLALDRAGEAKPHFVKAWALLKDQTWIRDDEPERYARLKKRAGAESEDGD